MMRLQIILPTKILADDDVAKVMAEGEHGSFGILPRHVDFLVALIPGLLTFQQMDGAERYAAVDRGLLIKHGPDVLVTTRRAVIGDDLHALQMVVEQEFLKEDERERHARSAMARLEADFIRRLMELERRVGA